MREGESRKGKKRERERNGKEEEGKERGKERKNAGSKLKYQFQRNGEMAQWSLKS